ncbi:Autoinducer 2 sensor kinase/phosphatase LuxQ [compost metagenome]
MVRSMSDLKFEKEMILEKTKILIVDDHPENIVALSELILSDDLHIMTAQKPDEALAHLLDHDFALCLLDVQMPDMSGFELAQLIRGVHKTRHLPVIFVTAHQHDKNIIFQGYESGAVDFLFKPLDPHIVRSKVRTFVELDKQNKLLKNKMEEVEFLRKKAEQANLSKSQFLANMSHEIRTPLASVLGFSDVLTQESLPEEEKADSLSAIRRNGELLLRLIDDILDLSKIEAHQLHFLKSDFSLVELLNDVESTLDLKAEDKGIDLKFDFPKDISITYYSDAIRIKQILLNVIGNALKFTEKGSVTVRLSIHKNSHGISKDTLVFEVQDTGVGIAENDIGNLFQPFSQADLSSRKKFGGTGLGLVISRELARSLDGDLKLISSKPGVGSFFEITLGLERSANTLAPSQSEVKHQAPEALKTSLANSKILVVDDVSDNRLLIERYMQGTGAQILQASNGIDAISLTEQENPDLVLMDIQMPIMDGYETVRRIRTGGYIRPIIALTAHAMKEEAQKCLDAGCDDVLTKPARRKELIARISETLEHDREQHPH